MMWPGLLFLDLQKQGINAASSSVLIGVQQNKLPVTSSEAQFETLIPTITSLNVGGYAEARCKTRSMSAGGVVTGSEQLWLRQTKAAVPCAELALARAG